MAELTGSATGKLAEYSWYPGLDNLHAVIVGTEQRYGHVDGLGNVIALTNESKVLKATYSYGDWGAHAGTADSNRARFKGALWMGPDLDLYSMRNRWYEPATGRFLSEDPSGLEGGINPAIFVGADPINGRDPSGLRGLPQCPEGYALYGMFVTNAEGHRILSGEPYCKFIGGSRASAPSGGGSRERTAGSTQSQACFNRNSAWLRSENTLVAGSVGVGAGLASLISGKLAQAQGTQLLYKGAVDMDIFFGAKKASSGLIEGGIQARSLGRGLASTGNGLIKGGVVILAVQATFALSYLSTTAVICHLSPDYGSE